MAKTYKINPVLAIALLVLLLALGWLIWRIRQVDKENGGGGGIEMALASPTPTLIPMSPGGYGPDASGAAELREEQEKVDKYYPLFPKLPYEERGVKISHYYKPLNLAVYVDLKQTTKEEAINIVHNFLKANNFSPYSHEIDWRYEEQ